MLNVIEEGRKHNRCCLLLSALDTKLCIYANSEGNTDREGERYDVEGAYVHVVVERTNGVQWDRCRAAILRT